MKYYGIRIGSKYTVVYGEGMSTPERIPTCVAKEAVPHGDGEFDYFFGREAEERTGAVFPILHGMPRGNGEKAKLIGKFLRFLKEQYDIPSDSYIVFCHPAMRAEGDAERFKFMCRSIDWGKAGTRFSLETFCGAIDALGGVDEARSTPAISALNFGSSTLEMAMFVNLRKVEGAGMRTVSFPSDGPTCPIATACDNYISRFIQHYDKYLGDLRLENEKVVNSLMRGSGAAVCTGGVVNTPGFGKFITSKIQGKFTKDLKVVVSGDGVTGPAKGAHALAKYIATGE